MSLTATAYYAYLSTALADMPAPGQRYYPDFHQLPPAVRAAWHAAARAVVESLFDRHSLPMAEAAIELQDCAQELREACTHPPTGEWDADYPTEYHTYTQRQRAATALAEAVAELNATLAEMTAAAKGQP